MSAGLVADIGGTLARLALVAGDPPQSGPGRRYRVETVYECQALDGVQELLDQYRETAGAEFPRSACLAVAGPIHGDLVSLTNLDWRFSIDALRSRFGFERLDVINDLEATAWAIPYLGGTDLVAVRGGTARERGTRAVIGVGTGLGVSAATDAGDHWQVMPSEGGHVPMSPSDENEAAVLGTIEQGTGAVSAETVLSGAGLVRLHRALARIHGHRVGRLTPESITATAKSDADSLSRKTVELFCQLLGRFAANTALTFCATGGVYLTGQLLCAMAPVLASKHFADRFVPVGAMKGLLEEIPVWLVTADRPGLIGAQARLNQRDGENDAAQRSGSA